MPTSDSKIKEQKETEKQFQEALRRALSGPYQPSKKPESTKKASAPKTP